MIRTIPFGSRRSTQKRTMSSNSITSHTHHLTSSKKNSWAGRTQPVVLTCILVSYSPLKCTKRKCIFGDVCVCVCMYAVCVWAKHWTPFTTFIVTGTLPTVRPRSWSLQMRQRWRMWTWNWWVTCQHCIAFTDIRSSLIYSNNYNSSCRGSMPIMSIQSPAPSIILTNHWLQRTLNARCDLWWNPHPDIMNLVH